MVYAAVGFVFVSLASLCYAYKDSILGLQWPWSRSKEFGILPEISLGIADTHHPDDAFSESETGAPNSKEAGVQVLNNKPIEKNDKIKEGGPMSKSAQREPEPRSAKTEIHNGNTHPDKVMNTKTSETPSGTADKTPKANMPPPARPGPRLRPKANNSLPPPSIPQPRKPTSLGVPQTAASLRPLPTGGSTLQPPPSLASTLRTPSSRSSPTPSSLTPTSSTLPTSKRPSKKVLLSPGHSPLDWAHLTTHPPSPTFLRGSDIPPTLIRVPPSLLKHHNGRKGKNAWGVWQGKVYNLTPYMEFHPGGVDELMKGAGRERDAERLFSEVHPWVNWEGLLGECLVGILVGEEEGSAVQGKEGGGLEDMD
ncbi:MAG: hypothetical protein Q9166_006128 [cf. Caloplaca sp. 2 TL-2023]